MRTPRLSKTPPSVYACRPNSPSPAPTSAPVSSRGGKNPGKADEAVDRHRHRRQAGLDAVDAEPVARLPAHHQEAVPVERAQAALAQVGGEEVQCGRLGQLEQAGIPVEVLLVVVFQQPRAGQPAVREAQQPARPAERQRQEEAAGDPVADVEPHEGEELGRRGVELAGRAVVSVPVQDQVGGEDAAAGDRGDVGDPGEDAGVAEEPDQAEVIQARPEAAAGEGQSDPIRAGVHDAAPPDTTSHASAEHVSDSGRMSVSRGYPAKIGPERGVGPRRVGPSPIPLLAFSSSSAR